MYVVVLLFDAITLYMEGGGVGVFAPLLSESRS
jgi:hypothetical protein